MPAYEYPDVAPVWAELIDAAKVAADALADAEHSLECEFGAVFSRAEWEARTQDGGPSEELYNLRKVIMEVDPTWQPRRTPLGGHPR